MVSSGINLKGKTGGHDLKNILRASMSGRMPVPHMAKPAGIV
jgi:hypothetical protein